VLRRSEQRHLSSASDNEVGESRGAIRAERAKRAEQSKWALGTELGEGFLAGADLAHSLTATKHRRAGMIV
jgi:hypothetical protein